MPIIVYKEMSLRYVYCQVRRITCDSCGEPFVFAATGTGTTSSTGVPLFSRDSAMRETVAEAAIKRAERKGMRRTAGRALCPHCSRYQEWMVSSSRNRRGWIGAGLGTVPGFVIACVINPESGSIIIAALTAGATLGYVLGRQTGITKGPHETTKDRRGMTDAANNAVTRALAGAAYYVLPNLEKLNINETIAHSEKVFAVGAADLLLLFGLATAFSAIFLFVGSYLFTRRDL